MKQTTAHYCEAIRQLLALKGIEATNDANHAALAAGLISLEQFQAAARILVAAFLEDQPTKGA